MTAFKILTTLPKVKEESTFEELCISDEKQSCKQEIKEDAEGISGDLNQNVYQAYESFTEQWFQVSTRLDQFCFYFYFFKSQFLLQLILHIPLYFRFQYAKFNMNKFLHLFLRWLHWKFHFM